ncbi:MAG: hypothetical protein QXE01_03080 [Sulfolobales archaeon]
MTPLPSRAEKGLELYKDLTELSLSLIKLELGKTLRIAFIGDKGRIQAVHALAIWKIDMSKLTYRLVWVKDG